MTTLLPTPYPVDLTGVAPSNLIVGEPRAMVRKKLRVIAPMHAPFFKKNLVITDDLTGDPLAQTQYKVLNIVSLPSAMAGVGNEVYALIVITDEAVSDSVSLTYQSVGGEYTRSYETTRSLLQTLSDDTRPSAWPNIFGISPAFDPSLHFHALGDAIGWEYVTTALEDLRNVMLFGDAFGRDALLAYVDQQTQALSALVAAASSSESMLGAHRLSQTNPHQVTKAQVGLGLVQDFAVATSEEAMQGLLANRYMTPSLVALAVEQRNTGAYAPHLSDTDNPHQVTKEQVGLGNLQNYPVAGLDDLQVPVLDDPHYVTNVVLKTYLTQFFSAWDTALTNAVAATKATADNALSQATSSHTAISTGLQTVAPALTNSAAALQAANNATIVAAACNSNTASSETLARSLLADYVLSSSGASAEAISAAQASGYNSGYTAGQSAGYAVGYADGESAGQTAGLAQGTAQGDAAGYTRGYDEGYTAGQSDGDAAGYGRGYSEGYIAGQNSVTGAQYFTVVVTEGAAGFDIPSNSRLVDIVASGAEGTSSAVGASTTITLRGVTHTFAGRLLGETLVEQTQTVLLDTAVTTNATYVLPVGGTLSVAYLKNR